MQITTRIVCVSLCLHAFVLAATPWIRIHVPDELLARMTDENEVRDTPEFFLDLRPTAYITRAEVVEPEVVGEPTAPVETPPEEPETAKPETTETADAPEALLEVPLVADAELPPLELEPVPVAPDPPVESVPDPAPPEFAGADSPDEPAQVADTAPADSVGAGRRSRTSLVGNWIVSAAIWTAGAASRPAPASPAAAKDARGTPQHGERAPEFAPRVLSAPKPAYPDACRRRGIEGSVLCRMHVDREGRVTDVDVVEASGDERLDRAAVRALERWRFDPPLRAGVKIESKVLHRVSFRLQGKP